MLSTIVNQSINAVQLLALIATIIFLIAFVIAVQTKNIYAALVAVGLAFLAASIIWLP